MLYTKNIKINEKTNNKLFQLYKIKITSKQRLNILNVNRKFIFDNKQKIVVDLQLTK